MKYLPLALLVLFVTPVAHADDGTGTVREVIDATAANWLPESLGNEEDVFSEDRLSRLFSKDFRTAYQLASRNPPYDLAEGETTGFPFDYDPIAQGQDGCSFENIRIENDGDGQIAAIFNNRRCFSDDPSEAPDTVLIFHVIEEGGRTVIDDIYPVENHQTGKSIKSELKQTAGQ